MHSAVAELESEGFPIRTIDVRYRGEKAMQYGIRSVPTFVYVRNGQELSRDSGVLSADEMKDMFYQ